MSRVPDLPGGRPGTVLAAVAALLVLAGGAWAAGLVGAPSVAGVDNAFGPVNQSTTVIETALTIHNPNPFGAELSGLTIDYAVEMNGIRMAEGHRRGVAVEQGNSTVRFRTLMDNGKLPAWWVSHVRNGERTTLVVDASVHSSLLGQTFEPQVNRTIETNIVGAFNSKTARPVEANQPVVSDPVLWLNETTGAWGKVTNETTEIEMTFTLFNPKPYPITITQLSYDVRMNGVRMGQGSTDRAVTIPPGETRTVEATTVLRNEHLDEWWVTHLRNDQVTELVVDFRATLDLSAAGAGTVTIPLDTMNRTIETDMFGNKGSDTADDGTGSTDTGTGTDRQTDAGTASGTATATPSPSPTSTPTPTPTDDGILGRVAAPAR